MIVGIDLGTTNSLVAAFIDGKPVVIPNRLGKLLTPSVVAVDEEDRVLVGEVAREYGYSHPFNVAKVFKRTMGTDAYYLLGQLTFRSEELSSLVLRSLKEDAEVYLKCPVEEAIISVPAYFDDNQRSATKKAGELAGLKVSRIISEPTASAIAYGVGSTENSEKVMVFDLGGGTFDVSILDYFQNIMEVHAIAGDNQLGGEDFTNVIIEMFEKQNNIIHDELDLVSLNNIYKAAEACKCSFVKKKKVKMSCVANNTVYQGQFTLEEYKQCCQPLLERIKKPIEKALHDADVTLSDIDRIILVGGATRLPIISEYVKEITGIFPDYCVDPDLSVCQGAALQCGMKMRDKFIEEIILTDVCPFTLGTEVVRDNGSFVETGHYLPIIERNTVIPVSKKETVYTAYDNQDKVDVKVLQGESRLARNNIRLGMLTVDVPVGPKGQEAVEITYTYDINSLLEVEVKVVSTGVEKKAIIKNENNKMSDEEIQQRLQLLSYLKLSPREEEENMLVLAKGERLYQQCSGEERQQVEQALFEFEKVLAEGTRTDIKHKRNEILNLFDEIDNKGFMDLLS